MSPEMNNSRDYRFEATMGQIGCSGHAAQNAFNWLNCLRTGTYPPFWIAMAILTGVWARYISIVAKEALFTPSETSLDPVRKSIGTYHNVEKELAVNRLL